MATEVKAFTPYSRNLTGVSARPPRTPGELAGLVLAAPEKKLGPNTNDNTCTSGRHALSRMHNPHDRTNLDAPALHLPTMGLALAGRGGNSCAGFPISPLDRFLRQRPRRRTESASEEASRRRPAKYQVRTS